MNCDISNLLARWPYEPGKPMVRQIKGRDGTLKIQLRLDVGLLQMNVIGRPDGKRPFEQESLLEHYQAELARYMAAHNGQDAGFELKAEDCSELQMEALQYHHRYLCLLQLGDFEGVVRDTGRNLAVFDLVDQYSEFDDLNWAVQQFRPQLLMIRARAQSGLALQKEDYPGAIHWIEAGMASLRAFFKSNDDLEQVGECEEYASLEAWLEDVKARRPLSRREQLEKALSDAVRREDYEKAAHLRDALLKLKTPAR